ncbi:MAG: phospholipid/cholesterol/gamma-HCH transport system substrate-binding protein [Actinomycetota bacterium]|nr:phospholipid/cholesterol/gamma-HCH transport system substrate-binding protein [Actinomycetota bacterium]
MSRRLLAALATVTVLVSGCGFDGIYSLPLPGAVANGANTYTVRVQFEDALDLVPFSAVKVNDATVGHVKSVGIEQRHAVVVCQLLDKVKLPANSIARVSQTSLLGEKFVEIHPPTAEAARGTLRDGDVIGLASTDTDATVEEVLGALSLLLSGGGLAQLHTIAVELNAALDGREVTARDLLAQLNTFVGRLDAQRLQIVQTIDHIDGLAATVRAQETTLTHAIDTMPTALRILADDRQQLTALLVSLQNLGTVATRVVDSSRKDLVANLKALQPTLTKLAEVGNVIPKSLEAIITYPTADGVEKAYFGDYGNISITVDASAASLANTFGGSGLPIPLPTPSAAAGSGRLPGLPAVPAVPPVPVVPAVPAVPKVPLTQGIVPPLSSRWLQGTSVRDMLLGVLR